MSTDLVQVQKKDIEIAEKLDIDIDIYRALRYSLFPDKDIPEYAFGLYLAYCKAKNYDPLKKPMHIVMMPKKTDKKDTQGKDIWEKHPVIMPGINSYRVDAARTGTFYGISDSEFGPIITKKFNNVEVSFPEWCKLIIYKKFGEDIREIPAKLYWLECYMTKNSQTEEPNHMWKKRPRAQLEKCCEALAYRKGFPEELGSIPTHEEMEGHDSFETAKDITSEVNENKPSTPLSQTFKVNEDELSKHLDKIKNATALDALQIAYKDAQAFAKGDKDAINKIADAKNEQKNYIAQLKNTKKEEVSDIPQNNKSNEEWLNDFNGVESKK